MIKELEREIRQELRWRSMPRRWSLASKTTPILPAPSGRRRDQVPAGGVEVVHGKDQALAKRIRGE